MSWKYEDILNLSRPESGKHPKMSMQDRAAQFSPFAALTGYGAVIQEAERLTEVRRELDELEKETLRSKLNFLFEHLDDGPEVTIHYFKADNKKEGGAYLSTTGIVKKLDSYMNIVLMMDGTKIPVDDIFALEGHVFSAWQSYGL